MGQELSRRLSGMYSVAACYDGEEALDILWDFCPDVMVIDLMVAGFDSLEIIRAARIHNGNCRFLVLGGCFSSYVLAALERENISCLMRTPCNADHLAGRIADLAEWEETSDNTALRIRKLLSGLGFRLNTESCRITEMALAYSLANPDACLSTQLYPAVAMALGGTVTQVEKAIRTGVECGWKNGDERFWRLYFGIGKNGKVNKPTNKEFLKRMTDCLRQEEKCAHKMLVVG